VLPGCFGGHPPAPPSSYALKRHGSHRLLFTPELTTTYMTGGARHQPSRYDLFTAGFDPDYPNAEAPTDVDRRSETHSNDPLAFVRRRWNIALRAINTNTGRTSHYPWRTNHPVHASPVVTVQ